MANPLGTYSFLSYLRIGLANKITQPDQDPIDLRATFDVQPEPRRAAGVAAAPCSRSRSTKPVQLYGPGDIVGIEPRAIFKTEPLNWITNFESNYLPYVDFYEEDFPWRYTPARADEAAHRLRPWIALVVLEEGEFEDGTNLQDKLLPFIQVDAAATKFPPADQLWAWAHVHVNADMAASDEQISSTNMGAVLPKLDAALKGNADVAYSRLLCPRRLKPNTAYHAFIIPTFETGRRAGPRPRRSNPISRRSPRGAAAGPERVSVLPPLVLPHGHPGRLRIPRAPAQGEAGRPARRPPRHGRAAARLEPAGPRSRRRRSAASCVSAARCACRRIVIEDMEDYLKYENWAVNGYPQPIQTGIANFLNLADDYQKPGANPQPIPDPDDPPDPDPLITPPLYGRWHAAVERLLTAADGDRCRTTATGSTSSISIRASACPPASARA